LNNPSRYTDPSGHRPCGDGEAHDCSGNGQDPNADSHKPPKKDENLGPITDTLLNFWESEDFYNGAATILDGSAWLIDLYAAGIVTYGGVYGAGLAIPFTVVGGPAVPTVTGLAGIVIAEFYVQPVLQVVHKIASASTVATVIADTKTGNTRIEDGVFSSSVRNSFTLTTAGWANKEAYLSLSIQSVALTNDFGWTSLPFQTNP
jgi:hypothetical protein